MEEGWLRASSPPPPTRKMRAMRSIHLSSPIPQPTNQSIRLPLLLGAVNEQQIHPPASSLIEKFFAQETAFRVVSRHRNKLTNM